MVITNIMLYLILVDWLKRFIHLNPINLRNYFFLLSYQLLLVSLNFLKLTAHFLLLDIMAKT